jgi:hypothetical protein
MLPRALDLWLPAYLRRGRPAPVPPAETHVLLCVCDHFEPLHGTDKTGALDRIALWRSRLPELAATFSGPDGVGPRHTFFYPVEQYDPDLLEPLADLCRASGAEVEIHLHHDRDTRANFLATLEQGKRDLAGHGFLSRTPSGDARFGFVHGNWALCDSHPDGRGCGVRGELSALREAGCYADFTMPSAPDRCQTRKINSLYYAADHPDGRTKSHDSGTDAAVGQPPSGDLLLVQGPLGLNWRRRKLGFLPRIENGDLTGANPPTPDRFALWLDLAIAVRGRPEWRFVKLHTHGALPRNSSALLGEPMRRFHAWLRTRPERVHYVTARELANILHAAEEGASGDPSRFRDHILPPPPTAAPAP